jgi:membrane protease YdiL (CAAX protease family)
VTDDGQSELPTGEPGEPAPAPPRSGPPGASTFTIEGRAAPGLFVIGWLASLLGLAIAVAGAFGGSPLLVFFVGPGLLSLGLIAACGNQAFERRARGAPYAGPSPFLVFGTIVAVSYFVGFVVGSVLDLVLDDSAGVAPPIVQLVVGLITAAVFVGVVRLTVVGTGALSWADMRIRRIDRRALDDLAIGVALAAPVVVVTLIVGAVLIALFQAAPTSPLPPTGTTSGLLLQLLVGAVIAPIAEEIVFRGFAITAWERTIGPDRAIIRASLLFALAHVISVEAETFQEAVGLVVVGFASRLPVAWVLGVLFVRRRSIWAPIGLHATFNAILLVLAHIAVTTAQA